MVLFPSSGRALASLRAATGCVAVAVLLAACSSDGTEPAPDTTGDATTAAPATDGAAASDAATSTGDMATSSEAGSSEAGSTEAGATDAAAEYLPSGEDGRYVVGDTYSDTEMLFTYEGLAAVPFEPQGEYSEGECYMVLGTVETLPDVPRLSDGDTIPFRPSFDPIFDGTPDEEQSNEFFNCDVDPVQELGYVQSSVTELAEGETATVWLDAIYVTPERVDTLDGFRLYGMDDTTFAAEVTQDLTE